MGVLALGPAPVRIARVAVIPSHSGICVHVKGEEACVCLCVCVCFREYVRACVRVCRREGGGEGGFARYDHLRE